MREGECRTCEEKGTGKGQKKEEKENRKVNYSNHISLYSQVHDRCDSVRQIKLVLLAFAKS